MLHERGPMEIGMMWIVFQDPDILEKVEAAGIKLEYDGWTRADFVELSPQVEYTVLDIG